MVKIRTVKRKFKKMFQFGKAIKKVDLSKPNTCGSVINLKGPRKLLDDFYIGDPEEEGIEEEEEETEEEEE